MLATNVPATQQHLQGLVTRRAAPVDASNPAAYFGHVADAVRANDEITTLRTYNLKRRWRVAHQGYEAVLNRKKRASVSLSQAKPAQSSALLMVRPGSMAVASVASTSNPSATAYFGSLQAAVAAATATAAARQPTPVPAKPVAKLAAPVISAVAQPRPPQVQQQAQAKVPKPAPVQQIQQPQQPQQPQITPQIQHTPPAQHQSTPHPTPAAAAATTPAVPTSRPTPSQTVQASGQQPLIPKRSDLTVGTMVLIRNTADLVACGARNLAGKMGRIVASPQIYGQELYSVYIDEHEALFQIPFNALTLVGRPQPTPMAHVAVSRPQAANQPQQLLHPATSSMATTPMSSIQSTSAVMMTSVAAPTPTVSHPQATPTLEQIKMEHSFQLHRLMQQQYREIQVLQQQYAECRLVNPSALAGIQQQLSKLRLVHLSQVQTLKSKQALDLLKK